MIFMQMATMIDGQTDCLEWYTVVSTSTLHRADNEQGRPPSGCQISEDQDHSEQFASLPHINESLNIIRTMTLKHN